MKGAVCSSCVDAQPDWLLGTSGTPACASHQGSPGAANHAPGSSQTLDADETNGILGWPCHHMPKARQFLAQKELGVRENRQVLFLSLAGQEFRRNTP